MITCRSRPLYPLSFLLLQGAGYPAWNIFRKFQGDDFIFPCGTVMNGTGLSAFKDNFRISVPDGTADTYAGEAYPFERKVFPCFGQCGEQRHDTVFFMTNISRRAVAPAIVPSSCMTSLLSFGLSIS